jgi:hypothetical protein
MSLNTDSTLLDFLMHGLLDGPSDANPTRVIVSTMTLFGHNTIQ